MEYKVEYRNNRTVFVFRNCSKIFEELGEIIDKIINPDHKSRIEITSRTRGYDIYKRWDENIFGILLQVSIILFFGIVPIGE